MTLENVYLFFLLSSLPSSLPVYPSLPSCHPCLSILLFFSKISFAVFFHSFFFLLFLFFYLFSYLNAFLYKTSLNIFLQLWRFLFALYFSCSDRREIFFISTSQTNLGCSENIGLFTDQCDRNTASSLSYYTDLGRTDGKINL